MDSLSQATLGAVVADAVLGRQLGRKATLWGLAVGTLPDLDILAYPFLDHLARLTWHRGLSHSLLGMVVATPLLAWLMRRIHGPQLGWVRPLWAMALVLITHVLIDCFTVYGTQVFEPFSDSRVAFNNLFIIDPLFTLPLVIATAAGLWLTAEQPWRQRLVLCGLALSSAYTLWSFTAKTLVDRRFEAQLVADGHTVSRWMSAPALPTTLLWRCLAEDADGYLIGYASLLDRDPAVRWRRLERNHLLLAGLEDSPAVERLRWFSQGWYHVRLHDGKVVFGDLRFGERSPLDGPVDAAEHPWLFQWTIAPDGRSVTPLRGSGQPIRAVFAERWQRMLGR